MARRTLNILADNSLLVLVLCATGALLFAAFAPDTVVGDTWLTLVSGRETFTNGLPHTDSLTIEGSGRAWINQQWLAHLTLYGAERLGGFGLLTFFSGLCVLLAYAIALVGVRARGATTRATLVVFALVLFAAPWTWTVRAQVLVLPLFAVIVVLSVDARDGLRRRSWLAIPVLLLWGNLHGSAFLGALIVSAVGALELLRRRSPLRAGAHAVLPWLALLVTPYGPVSAARYYRLLLIDPPFADMITEWQRPGVEWSSLVLGILLLVTIALLITGWRGFSLIEVVILALTAAVALQAVRGIYWFSIACLVILPPALDRALGLREPQPPRAVGRFVALVALAGLILAAGIGIARTGSRVAESWPERRAIPIRVALRDSSTSVFPTDRYADWLLWTIPELRGRIAYDVRFEIYTRDQIERNVHYNGETGPGWKRVTDGYDIVVLDNLATTSHLRDFLAEPGTKIVYRDADATIVRRTPSD